MSDKVVKSSSITREHEFALRPNAEERVALAEADADDDAAAGHR